jgi:hypothetical protein
MPNIDSLTKWLLRLAGSVICCSLAAIFLPLPWMQQTHEALGLGTPPTEPIFEYLARTISAMYFMHGAVMLFVTTEMRRYWPFVGLLGTLNVVVGSLFFAIDLKVGLPGWWTALEGPPIAGFGGLLLLLWWLGREQA